MGKGRRSGESRGCCLRARARSRISSGVRKNLVRGLRNTTLPNKRKPRPRTNSCIARISTQPSPLAALSPPKSHPLKSPLYHLTMKVLTEVYKCDFPMKSRLRIEASLMRTKIWNLRWLRNSNRKDKQQRLSIKVLK